MMPLRSLLFTPGNNLRMLVKSGTLRADAVILDLEDSVPMGDKETARLFVRDSLKDAGAQGSRVFVRINGSSTGLAGEDLDWVVQPGLHAIVMPKAERAADVEALARDLEKLEAARGLARGSVKIVPILESARGVLAAQEIAAGPRVAAVAFGGVDFSRDMGIALTAEAMELLAPRAKIAMSARAAGVPAIDTPCIQVDDAARLEAESRTSRGLGFRGKLCIHPSQVGVVNAAFSPSASELEYARKVVAAFREAQAQGAGAISLDGKMIDVANFRQAEDLLATGESIEKGAGAGA